MSYRESQDRIVEAEAALKSGDAARARELFREAARLQRAFIDRLPPDRVRTKSIYGLSAATLLYRAGDLEEAARLAHQLLSETWIEPYSAEKLRELLMLIWGTTPSSPPSAAGSTGASGSKSDDEPPPSHTRARTLPSMGPGPRLRSSCGRLR